MNSAESASLDFGNQGHGQQWNLAPQEISNSSVNTVENVGQCTCQECGREFSVQRRGAVYVCERCVESCP